MLIVLFSNERQRDAGMVSCGFNNEKIYNMNTTEIIHNALEWANKRLELQGEPITENQRNYIVFALRQQLTIPAVSKSFTAEEVINELEDCDTLDDAIMFFKEQM